MADGRSDAGGHLPVGVAPVHAQASALQGVAVGLLAASVPVGPGGFVLLDLPCVVEGHCLPAVGKVFLQFKLEQQALVAAGFVDGVGPHGFGAAQGHAFGTGQVAAGPLAAEVGLDLPGGGQGLQAV